MSAFDAQVMVLDHEVLVPEEIPEGAQPIVQVALTLGMVVPVQTPQGLVPARVPWGVVRFTMDDRTKVEHLAETLREAAESLPNLTARSDLQVASNLEQVKQAAAAMQAAQQGKIR